MAGVKCERGDVVGDGFRKLIDHTLVMGHDDDILINSFEEALHLGIYIIVRKGATLKKTICFMEKYISAFGFLISLSLSLPFWGNVGNIDRTEVVCGLVILGSLFP